MYKLKHTPGSWKYDPEARIDLEIRDKDGSIIADVRDNRKFTLEQCRYNAQLISAAPDLIESVIALRNQLLSIQMNIPALMPLQNEQRNMLSAALLQSEKAIKKATQIE